LNVSGNEGIVSRSEECGVWSEITLEGRVKGAVSRNEGIVSRSEECGVWSEITLEGRVKGRNLSGQFPTLSILTPHSTLHTPRDNSLA
jgi:hypothetical protein